MTRPPGSLERPAAMQRVREEASLLAHGLRQLLAPQNIWNGIKTLAWLGPLTLLIWFYAEREQTQVVPKQPIPISVRSSNPNIFVELKLRDKDSNVTADLSGPRGQLDDLIRKLEPNDDRESVVLTIPAAYLVPGESTPIDVAPLLRNNPIFANTAVQVSNCSPARISISVDTMEVREMEVKVPDNKNIETAIFDPPTIRVRAPGEVFKHATKLEAQLGDAVGTPAEHKNQPVHVKLAVDSDVTASQLGAVQYGLGAGDSDIVKATYTVKENAQATFVYPSIPIFTLAPPLLLSRYNIEIDQDKDTLANVEVIGPKDKIEALQSTAKTHPEELPKPRAILEVTGEDRALAGQSSRPRQLRFDRFPDTSITISPKDESRTVTFRIVDRTMSQ